jgi:hypothetical protein
MSRPVHAHYIDPLSHIWVSAAQQLGLRVGRDPLGYATTDGSGQLTIAPDDELDSDDCLAQIILHELCHALIEGEASFQRPDWGLHSDGVAATYGGDAVREEACLRLQAALLRPHGLRGLLGPTTEFRSFYDALPADPLDRQLSHAGDPALPLAWEGLRRASQLPFRRPIEAALQATAAIHAALGNGRPAAPAAAYDVALALGSGTPGRAAIWRHHPPAARHPSGLPLHDGLHGAPSSARCGDCGFAAPPLRGQGRWRCQFTATADTPARSVDQGAAACALFRPPLDCQQCAACCRHAYDLVPVKRREPAAVRHAELIEYKGRSLYLRRHPEKQRCAALAGPPEGPYGCTIYHDRPSTCRDFSAGSTSCLDARRRVGLESGPGR